jgi:hypothetical protein
MAARSKSITLGTARSVSGKVVWGVWRPINDDAASEVAVAIVGGSEPGPTLWLQGAIHGNENDAALIVQRVIATVAPANLRGTLIGIPVVNQMAFKAGQRDVPIDGKDANRHFPGRSDGSYTDRLAHAISTSIKSQADYLIDVHSSTETFIGVSHCLYFASDSDASRESEALARRSQARVIWKSSGDYMERALYCWAVQHDIPCALFDPGDLDVSPGLAGAVDGVLNMLRHAKMLPGQASHEANYYVVRDPRWVTAQAAGVVSQSVAPGERVKKGDNLFEVFNLGEGHVDSKVDSNADGLVLSTRRLHKVGVGDWVVSLGEVTHEPAAFAVGQMR